MISKRLLNKWQKLQSSGDIKAIAELTNKTESTICRIVGGKQICSTKLALEIYQYFKQKETNLKQLS